MAIRYLSIIILLLALAACGSNQPSVGECRVEQGFAYNHGEPISRECQRILQQQDVPPEDSQRPADCPADHDCFEPTAEDF